MKVILLLLSMAGVVSGCATKVALQPADFLPTRLPSDPRVEVKNDAYQSVTAGYEPRREVEPEPWSASNGTPHRRGGGN